ncbi:SDR family oxidoreductase [Marinicella gelatinilytica]|uniref:SDR family oxidoreductase n=1 Tax=Marinicella gelatinilytica TaxID=2996017 RepID=UPI0022610403|nr:SDR family oxidoreductase [Marinicella gelatinilytica]MCX7544696.1 SDR family oxidoreductase [Marinicella gelatinilytica]
MSKKGKHLWAHSTVLITGATGGLGQALVKRLDQAGAQLIVHGRDESLVKQLVDSLDNPADYVVGDLTTTGVLADIRVAAEKTKNRHRLLINNAAINFPGFLHAQSDQSIVQTIEVNLTVPILLSRHLLSWLSGGGQGRIVNIGSSFGGIGYPGFSSYCATKFGLLGFSQALHRELRSEGIQVHYLAPRAMDTRINNTTVKAMNKQLKNGEDKPQAIADVIMRAIEKNQQQRFLGWPEKFFVKLNSLFPGLVSRSINRDLPIIQQHLNQENSHEI